MALNHVPKMFSARHVYNFYKDIASSKINNHCSKKELKDMKLFVFKNDLMRKDFGHERKV